jgi:hypothetical protein
LSHDFFSLLAALESGNQKKTALDYKETKSHRAPRHTDAQPWHRLLDSDAESAHEAPAYGEGFLFRPESLPQHVHFSSLI